MIAVLASRLDAAAQELVQAWSGADAGLLSAEDLCTAGWRYRVGDPGHGTMVVAGRRVSIRRLRAVVTRRPAVAAEELQHIDPSDRDYLAAEVNAFLVAWLSALPRPVLNRPTPTSLDGPAWGPLHWAAAAARADVPWTDATDATAGPADDVLVCGNRCLGARSRGDAATARRLARAAGVELLGLRMRNGRVCAVSRRPELASGERREMVLDYLVSRHRATSRAA